MGRLFTNSVSDYLGRASTNLGLNGLTEMSVAFWMRMDSQVGGDKTLIDKEFTGGISGVPFRVIFIDSGNFLRVQLINNTLVQTPLWEVGFAQFASFWNRYLFTWKRNAITIADGILYVNGQVASGLSFAASGYSGAFTLEEDTNNLYYGIRAGSLTLPMHGAMESVNIWNRQLTAAEAYQDYLRPNAVIPGLVSGVHLDQLSDYSSGGGTLSITGAVPIVTGPTLPMVDVYSPHFLSMVAA